MDMSRWMALGVQPIVLTGNPIGADALVAEALEYQDSGAGASPLVDDESQWEIVGYQFSGDTASSWSFEDASGGTLKGPTHYYANNTVSPLIECMIEMGKGKGIFISGAPSGKFSIIVYAFDHNYKNRKRAQT